MCTSSWRSPASKTCPRKNWLWTLAGEPTSHDSCFRSLAQPDLLCEKVLPTRDGATSKTPRRPTRRPSSNNMDHNLRPTHLLNRVPTTRSAAADSSVQPRISRLRPHPDEFAQTWSILGETRHSRAASCEFRLKFAPCRPICGRTPCICSNPGQAWPTSVNVDTPVRPNPNQRWPASGRIWSRSPQVGRIRVETSANSSHTWRGSDHVQTCPDLGETEKGLCTEELCKVGRVHPSRNPRLHP